MYKDIVDDSHLEICNVCIMLQRSMHHDHSLSIPSAYTDITQDILRSRLTSISTQKAYMKGVAKKYSRRDIAFLCFSSGM